jgi:uncharacterized protein (DUF305 family)
MNHTGVRRAALVCAAALSALVVLAACGGNDDDAGGMNHGAVASSTAASAPATAAFNDADVEFAQMMIPHHKQAVEMAELADTRANDAEVKQLATQIKAAQQPEIDTMTGWLTAWGKPTSMPSGGHNMPGMSSMPGEMSEEDMTKLEAAKGTEFDRMFAQMMSSHHNGAIQMARDEQAEGSNPEATALAAQIEKTQKAEVTKLQQIVDRL